MALKLVAAVASAALALAASSTAAAGTVLNVSLTLDANDATFGFGSYGWSNLDVGSLTLGEGDTLDIEVDFAGNQQVTVTDLGYLWAPVFKSGAPLRSFETSATVSLLKGDGSILVSSNPYVQTYTFVDSLNQPLFSSRFSALPAELTFAGLRFTTTINDFLFTDAPAHYEQGHVAIRAATFVVSEFTDVSPAPEPAAWAALLLGLGGSGAMLRARRRQMALHKQSR